MCLIIISFREHTDYPLTVAANRDEFLNRAAEPLAWRGDILAGYDMTSGGTWLGINRAGRFAAVTNYREPGNSYKSARSRGLVVKDFLASGMPAEEYAIKLEKTKADYNGYNLLFGNKAELWYFSNRAEASAKKLSPGLYGLSNHLLDTPWYKVRKAKERFLSSDQSAEEIFALLADPTPAPDEEVQQTGMPADVEKALSSIFIASPSYGTRVSSYLRLAKDGAGTMQEHTYDASSSSLGFVSIKW